ncbi:MAG: ABC transporter ATP-binding protein [Acidobacteriota bacterium]
MIRLESIEKVYRTDRIETVALSGISLDVGAGEFVSVMGPSGCGKSTLLNIIGLLDKPSKGRVTVADRSVTDYGDVSVARLRNERLGFIFQSFHLIPDLSVLDNVELPLIYRRTTSKERRERAAAALDRVGLSARTRHFPSQLSGGQQQRVAIARAIVGKPHVILADEPTGNLDSHMSDEIMNLLLSLSRDDKTTVVMVTHDQRLAEQTQRTIRLFDGRQVN